MAGWGEFVAAFAAFLLSHMIPVRPPVRPWLVERLGLVGYIVCYSLLSVAILIWLIGAAARAPYVAVLPDWSFLRLAPLVAMPVVCWLAIAGMAAVNPLSFGGMGKGTYDADNPGILRFSRHPLPLALALWAFAHLLANGDLAHVILFGVFGLFALAGMAMIDRRKQRNLGPEVWQDLSRNTSLYTPAGLRFRVWEMAGAAGVYTVLLYLHGPVIGLEPWP